MLSRMIPVSDRSLFIDGVDINTIDIKILRRHIGYVPQDTFLFSERIADNLLFGVETACPGNNAEEMARMAAIESEIQELPYQYESYLGERGSTCQVGKSRGLPLRGRWLLIQTLLSWMIAFPP